MIRGWKLVTLVATIIVYVVGILVLSIVNLQSPPQKRMRNSRFLSDVSAFLKTKKISDSEIPKDEKYFLKNL